MVMLDFKKSIRKIFLGCLLMSILFSLILYFASRDLFDFTQVVVSELQYPADFSDDRILVGAAHNIFIGKVIRQFDTREMDIGPETQFEVKVIDNVKGELQGNIMVNQQGGYRGSTLYVVEGDIFSVGSEKESLLQTGSTYVFMTRYNPKEDWHTIVSFPGANKLLSTSELSVEEMKMITINDPRVSQLREVYPHEVLLEADVRSGNARNSFISVGEKERIDEFTEGTDSGVKTNNYTFVDADGNDASASSSTFGDMPAIQTDEDAESADIEQDIE